MKKLAALLRNKQENNNNKMKMHDHYWFRTYGKNTTYNQEEVELVWQSLSTSQIDFFQELCEYFYEEGKKHGRDEC